MGPGMGRGGWMAGADAGAFVAGRLAALKAELGIQPEQEAAWAAFEAQAQQQAASMQALHQQMQAQMHGARPAASAADFNALHEAMFKLRQAGLETRAAALKDLYAVLTPEQKALADQRLGGGHGYGRGMGRPFN
jgi:Spy/CpxP family protein refolding chaperone